MDKTIKLFLSNIIIAILMALVVFLFAFYFYLYCSAIEREKSMLLKVVNSNSKLLEAIAKFDTKFSQTDDPEGAEGTTLSPIKDFVTQFSKGNPDYTIQVLKMLGSEIKVISFSPNKMNNFSENWDAQNKELLMSVVNGHSDTNIVDGGLNNQLILAYSKINVLDYSMIISVNLKEIRKPYIRSLYIGIISCIVLILFLGYIIRKKAQPVIEKLNFEIEKKNKALETLKIIEKRLDIALSVNKDGILDLDIGRLEVYIDARFFSKTGYQTKDYPCKYEEWINCIHPDDRLQWDM